MNGLLGNFDSAKFIFIACDEESWVPTPKEIKTFFPNSLCNIYKAWGHFKDNFKDLENLFHIRRSGIQIHGCWNNHGRIISHAIRVENTCPRNSFFDLKYGDFIVDALQIGTESLGKLDLFLQGAAKMNSAINSVCECKNKMDATSELAKQMSLKDEKIASPSKSAVADIFDGYGVEARAQMMKALNQWYDQAKWSK
jgi:hypothetical protein